MVVVLFFGKLVNEEIQVGQPQLRQTQRSHDAQHMMFFVLLSFLRTSLLCLHEKRDEEKEREMGHRKGTNQVFTTVVNTCLVPILLASSIVYANDESDHVSSEGKRC